MKRVVFLAVATLFAAGLAFGQAGNIGIYADQAGTNCNLAAPVGGAAFYYIVHVNTPGATGSEYAAPKPACLSATWLADTNAFPVTVGNSQTGVSIGYGICRVAPILLQTLTYLTSGAASCCYYPVVPHPVNGGPNVVDCAEHLLVATGGKGIVNSNPTCYCDVPVQDTTWGQVKALYTE